MKKILAVYAGSFDPLTLGHLWVIEQTVKAYDLIVAIGVNAEKTPAMFSVEERLEMIKKSIAHLKNIRLDSYPDEYLVHYARSVGAQFIIRGIRSVKDYEAERAFGDFNQKIDPNITTITLIPPPGIADVSSSMVKGLIGPKGWEEIVKAYVPEPVLEKLKETHGLNLLRKQWFDLWERIGAKGDASLVLQDLVVRYREPHRHYHTIEHINDGLMKIKQVRHLAMNHNALEMAWLFHDAIYDTKAKDNEEKSAELARTVLKNTSLSDDFIDWVSYLILMTKHNELSIYPDAQLIADIDLSSLGAADEVFNENRRKIGKEYICPEISKEAFLQGNAAFLKSLLERISIYSTQFFRDKYETQTRKNISRAIAQSK